MSKELQTTAYLGFTSTQDWTSDPDFVAITITEGLALRVAAGLKVLRESGFNSITDTRTGVDWTMLAEHDDGPESGYVPFDPEYTALDPDIRINRGHEYGDEESSVIQFIFNFKHTPDEGWCEISGKELAACMDKAWVESYGYVFMQLPDTDGGIQGKWLCIDPACPDGFAVECDSLIECVEKAASWLEDTVDETMEGAVLRPKIDGLRTTKAVTLAQAA